MIALYLPSLLIYNPIVLSFKVMRDSCVIITLSLITNFCLAPSSSTKSLAVETNTGCATGNGLDTVSVGYLLLNELTNSCSV